jgi:general secretion pathway protein A
MHRKYLSLLGIKFNPFGPDLPLDALWRAPAVETFCFRVTQQVRDGGFAMISGDPGLGKSAMLRLLADALSKAPEVIVGEVSHPQSGVGDFYRELGDLFGVTLSPHNRWNGFKSLRQRWQQFISQSAYRPILLIDEAQEMNNTVLSELRLLSSKDLDAKQLLMVILCGDQRLPEKLSTPELMSIGSRARARLKATTATVEQLGACLDHVLVAAGNASLMTPELKRTVCEHSMGNYRVMMGLCNDLLMTQASREHGPPLDEKLFLEVFTPPTVTRPTPTRPRRS